MRRISALGLAAVLVAACSGGGGGGGGGGGPGPTAVLVSIAVTPATAVTVAGATVKLTATGTYDDGGRRDVTAEASWSSSNAGVVQVSAGVATGGAPGTATLTAAIGAIQGTAQLTVDTPSFVSLRAEPANATVSAGQSTALRCIGTTDKGLEIDVTTAATWESVDPLVATVARGVVSGVKAGGTDVRATYAGLGAQAHVTVEAATLASLFLGLPSSLTLAVGETLDARAFSVLTDGSVRDVTLLADWSSSAPSATVSNVAESAGRIRALAPGAGTITAAFEGKVASSQLTVGPDGVIFVLVDPAPSPLPVGVAFPLRATALHADGTTADVTALAAWSSDSAAVTVNAAGVATAVAGGVATVRASYGGAVGLASLAVTGDAPTGLELDAATYTLGLGDYTWPPPVVKLRYANGSVYDVSIASKLAVADPAIGIVGMSRSAGDPIVTGVGLGTTTLEARYAGLIATASLTVVAPLSFAIDAPASVPAGVSWNVKATTRVQGKYVVETEDVTPYAEWTSSAPEVIAISNAAGTKGTATVVGAGSATLTATFGGRTATKTVTVVAPLSSITITPAPLLVATGAYPKLSATAHLTDGRTTDATTLVTWRCDRAIGSMSGSTLWTSSSPGTGEVTAAIGDVFGTATVTVVRDPSSFGGLAIRPAVSSYGDRLPVGHTAQLRAVYVYSVGGQNVDVPVQGEVNWTSGAPATAAFDDPAHPGRVHALAAGTVVVSATAKSPSGAAMQASMSLSIVNPSAPLALVPVTIPLGGTAPLSLTVPNGTTTSYATAFASFESADPAIVEVRGSTAVARRLGTVELRAHLDDLTVVAQATVVPATPKALVVALPYQLTVGGKTRPGAFVQLDNGDYVDVTTLAAWSCSTPQAATLTWTPGTAPELQVIAAGTATVAASWSGLAGTEDVIVVGAPVEPALTSLSFNRASYEVPVGGWISADLVEAPQAGGTSSVTGPVVTVTPADVASVSFSGQYGNGSITGLKLGSALITATWGGKTTTAVVNVTHAVGDFGMYPVDNGPYALHPHEPRYFSAYEGPTFAWLEDALTWSSSNPAVVKVVAPGAVVGVAPGTAIVWAASGRQVWPWAVTVSSAPLERVELSGVAPMLPIGAVYRFRATARWSDGASLDVTSAATWWSADPTVADFDPAVPGKLVAKRAGTVRIEARIDGTAAPAEVTVF